MARKQNIKLQDAEHIELPSVFADRLGLSYTKQVTVAHKKDLGQYFTPIEVAKFMASFVQFQGKKVKILDPGCGTGVLSCAVAEQLALKATGVEEIELTAFESDVELIPYAEKSFSHLREWLNQKK